MENLSVKMAPAFLIFGKVICLYLSLSFMGTVSELLSFLIVLWL